MKLSKSFKIFIIIVVTSGWIFSGWLLFEIKEIKTTLAQIDASFNLPPQGVAAVVDDKGEAKIDIEGLSFNLPSGAGEVELYALPDECLGATELETKRKILTYYYCGDPIGFSIFRPNDYVWKINRPTRFLIGACRSQDIDCGDHPEDFIILFISSDTIGPGIIAGKHQFLPKP